MKSLVKVSVILLIVICYSCNQSNRGSTKNNSNQTEPVFKVSDTNYDNCILRQDSIVIKQFVVELKSNLKTLNEESFLKLYKLSKSVHKKKIKLQF